MAYCRLAQSERYQIEALVSRKISIRSIAAQLGRAPSTISREHKRGLRLVGGYSASYSEMRANWLKKKKKFFHRKISGSVEAYIRSKILLDWSPDQIANRMKLENQPIVVSHMSIYRFIQRERNAGGELWRHLRITRKTSRHTQTRGVWCPHSLMNRISIERRPEIVEDRIRLGDYERDLLEGKRGESALLTIVDRTSRKLLLEKVSKKAEPVHQATLSALRNERVYTITNDNGTEFAGHEKTAGELGVTIYFNHPNSSWERGTNENTNGLLRQYFPKKHSLNGVSKAKLGEIQEKLNNRPRRCLDYRTPNEVHLALQSQALR